MQEVPRKSNAVFLRGFRTTLIPLEEEHAPYLQTWINDPEVRRCLMNSVPLSLAEEKEFIERRRADKNNIVLGIVADDNTFIGTMGLHRIRRIDDVAATGSMIGEKDYWSQGYGTDAKMTLLHYAFYTLNLRKVNSSVLAFNGRSKRCLEKCGYREEGVKKKEVFRDGEYHDEIMMAVFRENFDHAWNEYAARMEREQSS